MAVPATRAQQIPFASALYVLATLVTVVAGAMLLPAFTAIGRYETEIAAAFSGAALAGAFLGGGLMLALQGTQRPALMRENLALIVLAWIVLCLYAAVPLLTSGVAPTPIDAIFEATSAFTTTGASILGAPEALSPAILLWLGELQWLGGYATVVMAATVLSALGTAGLDVKRTLLPLGHSDSVSDRFFHIAGSVTWIYGTVTILGFFAIWAGGVPRFDAFCLALSGIATGGLKLDSAGFGAYHAPLSELALIVLTLFGTMNFLTHWAAWRSGSLKGNLRTYGADPEFWLLLMGCLLAALLLTVAEATTGLSATSFTLFNAVSLVTTSGFWAGPVPAPSGALILGALALAFVGGASVSTSGGLKLMRLWLLFTHARHEIRRLVHPRSAFRVRFRGRVLDEETMRGIWAFFVGYVAVFGAVTLALSSFGLSPVKAISATVSALSNTGPLLDIISGGGEPYRDLPDGAKGLLAVVMIAGRVEVLAVISLLHPAFWRR